LFLAAAQATWVDQIQSDIARLRSRSAVPNDANDAHSVVRSIPVHESRGFKQFTYMRWFAAEADGHKSHLWWYNLQHADDIQVLAQFRLGAAHWLNIENGRHARPRIPRDHRLCTCCELGVVEDALHITECSMYEGARLKYANLFDGYIRSIHDHNDVDASFNALMNYHVNDGDAYHFWSDMAAFLKECLLLRQRTLIELSE